jgi:oligoribonuclease NrnB/cAMP/cGMP phosphodiesterase (DHH superfamily)
MKSFLITHKDLDGCVSAMVIKASLGPKIGKIYDVAYKDVIPTFKKVLNRMDRDKNTRLFVTDIAADGRLEEFNTQIGRDIRNYTERIWWIDHHPENYVCEAMEHKVYVIGKSAAMLTYEIFSKQYDLSHLRKLVVYADDYDLWNLKYKKGWLLSDLYYYYWTEKFMKRFMSGDLTLNEEEKQYLLKLDKGRKMTWKRAQKELLVNKNEYGKFYVVFTTRKEDVNFLCEKLKRDNKEGCDFIVAVTGGDTVSLRAINQEIDFTKILPEYGGGGHPLAAGIQMDIEDDSHPFVKKFFRRNDA